MSDVTQRLDNIENRLCNIESLLKSIIKTTSNDIKMPELKQRSKTEPLCSTKENKVSKISTFNLSLFKKNTNNSICVAIYGKKSNGKTTCALNCMHEYKSIANGLCITKEYEKYCMNVNTAIEYDIQMINDYLNDYEHQFKWMIIDGHMTKSPKESHYCQSVFNNSQNTFNIIISQYPVITEIIPDYVLLFKETRVDIRRKLYDMYVSNIVSFGKFNKLLEEYANNVGHCIVIDINNKQIYRYVNAE